MAFVASTLSTGPLLCWAPSALFDGAAVLFSQPGSLRSLYCTAMRFEAAFFSEQPATPPPPRVALLAADFDETCTVSDTTGAIIDAAIDAAVRRSEGGWGQGN